MLPGFASLTERRWFLAFIISVVLGFWLLSQTLGRPSDGDDVMSFYESGMRSWPIVLTMVVVPPGSFKPLDVPQVSGLLVPAKRVSVFDRWRPVGMFLIPKALWEFGLSPDAYRVINWLVWAVASAVYSWGLLRLLSLGIPSAPQFLWPLTCLIWWSPPAFFTVSGPFYYLHLPMLFSALSFGIMAAPGAPGSSVRVRRIVLASITAFLAFQSHENAWWLFLWAGLWLTALYFGGVTRRKKDAPTYWWPFAMVLAHVLIYRRIGFGPDSDWTGHGGQGIAFEGHWAITNVLYLALTTFNGLVGELPVWAGVVKHPLDVTPSLYPWPFLLTLAGILCCFLFKRSDTGAKQKFARIAATISLAGVGLATFAPYMLVKGHRFVHYAVLPSSFLAIVIVLSASHLKKLRWLPVLLVLIANASLAAQFVGNWNWIIFNQSCSKKFRDPLLDRPDLKGCTSENPCCIRFSDRSWNKNEWVLNWNSGAPKYPAFYPAEWPGVKCSRVVIL